MQEEFRGARGRRVVRSLEKASYALNRLAELLLASLVALTIAVTFLQVLFRYVLGSSLTWSEELSRYVFVWIIFIGVSVATRRGEHILVDVFHRLIRGTIGQLLAVFIGLCCVAFFLIFTWT